MPFILLLAAFVDMMGTTMVLPLLPYYALRHGASGAAIGGIVAAFAVAQLIAAPRWGAMSDRRGRRPVIVAGLLVSAAGYAAFAVAGSVSLLLAARAVQGVGGGTIGVIHAYIADITSPRQRTRSLGWLTAVTSLGAVAGPAVGAWLARAGGQALVGGGAAAFVLLVAGIATAGLRESRVRTGHTAEMPVAGAGVRDLVRRWREPAARLVWVYAIGIGAFYGTIAMVPLLLARRLGVGEATVGWFFMYLGAVGVLVRAAALGPMAARLGEPMLARTGLVVLASGLLGVALAHDRVAMVIAFTLMPVGTACLFPAVTSLLTGMGPRRERGALLGAQQTVGGIARVVVPIAAGAAMDAMGPGIPFLLGGVALLAALPLATALPRPAAVSGAFVRRP